MVFSSSRKKKTALPVIQEEKIENSERDESRVDAKRLGGGGGGSHTRAKIPQKCQQDQNRQVSLINTLTYPSGPSCSKAD